MYIAACIADRSEGFLRDSIGIFNIINYLGIFRHFPMVFDGFRWFFEKFWTLGAVSINSSS